MSEPDNKIRILAFLTKHRDWYQFSGASRVKAPDLDQALADLLVEGLISRIEVNDRPYFQLKRPERPERQ